MRRSSLKVEDTSTYGYLRSINTVTDPIEYSLWLKYSFINCIQWNCEFSNSKVQVALVSFLDNQRLAKMLEESDSQLEYSTFNVYHIQSLMRFPFCPQTDFIFNMIVHLA